MTEDNETTHWMGAEFPADRMLDAIALRAKLLELLDQFVVGMEESMKSVEELINAEDDLTRLGSQVIFDWRKNNNQRLQSAIKVLGKSKRPVPKTVTGVSEIEKALDVHSNLKADYYAEDKVLDWKDNQVYYKLYKACCELLYEELRHELNTLKAENERATVDVALSHIRITIFQYAQAVKDEWLDEDDNLPFDDDDLNSAIIATLVDDQWVLAEDQDKRITLLPYAKGVPVWEEGDEEHEVIEIFKENPNNPAELRRGLRNLNSKKQ